MESQEKPQVSVAYLPVPTEVVPLLQDWLSELKLDGPQSNLRSLWLAVLQQHAMKQQQAALEAQLESTKKKSVKNKS